MKRSLAWSLLALSPLVVACGDDGSAGTETDTSSSTSTSGSTTDNPTTDPTSSSSSSGLTTASSSSSSTTSVDGSESSSSSDTDEATGSTTGGEQIDCTAIPEGPFAPNVQFMPFNGSEDLGFNGLGGLAGKDGGNIIIVDSEGVETASYPDAFNPSYGLRFTVDGDLLVAHPSQGEIGRIGSDGSIDVFASGLGGVNGVYPDLDGNVWVTNFGIVGRYSADGTLDTLVSGADAANSNGIVYDPDRSVAFYTNYGAGRVLKVDIMDDGTAGDVTALGQVGGAAFDGLALDACGNLYAVDNGTPRVFRLMLDENAEAIGELTDIVDGNMQNVANAQFGRGEGFDPNSIYVTGNPGVVYRLEVGVPGAEIPLP